MNAKDILLGRIEAQLAELSQAAKALKSEGVDNQLRSRMGNEFHNGIQDLTAKLENDRSLVKYGVKKESWTMLDTRSRECAELFRECLAFLQGARTRGAGADADMCEIADKLLDELSGPISGLKWSRFTMLADRESFVDMTQIIRLRFPLVDIWSLPVAAHEFGHFLAERLNVRGRDGVHRLEFQDYVKERAPVRQDKTWFHLNEHFADLFATYATGPAYGFTCMLLRFLPGGAWQEREEKHPPDGHRVYVILATLGKMNEEGDSKGEFAGPVKRLDGYWRDALASAGESPDMPGQNDQQRLKDFVSKVYAMLKGGAPDVRYKTWTEAKRIKDWLLDPSLSSGSIKLVNLLNAAWMCRLEEGADLQKINDSVVQLARR